MIIKCWECKNDVSSTGAGCPHCGAPVYSQCPECGEWALETETTAIYHEPITKVKAKSKIFPFPHAYVYEKTVSDRKRTRQL